MSSSRTTRRRLAAFVGVTALFVGACSAGGDEAGDKDKTSNGDKANGKATTTTANLAKAAAATAASDGKAATAEASPSAGCGSSKTGQVSLEKQMLDGSERYWLLTTPPEHDGEKALPLVLDFHGLLEGADVHAKNSALADYGAKNGFVVAVPNGTGSPVHWEVDVDRSENPDLVFVDALLDQLERDLCVDTSRIYATGLSNGAFLSSIVACTMSDRFAAVAPVAGLIRGTGCKPERPVPILTFHGTEDPILLFNGGVGDRLGNILAGKTENLPPIPKADLDGKGYPETAREWAKANGCATETDEEAITDTITQRSFDCPAEGAVVFDIIAGGGHTWPGSEFSVGLEKIMGPTDQSTDANDLIWAFFQRFALPAADAAGP